MNLRLAFVLTSQALEQNRMRTALTVLGVAIGVAAVITIVALGRGAREQIDLQIQSIGTNVVMVMAGNVTSGGVRAGQGASGTLTAEDGEAIRRDVTGVQYVSALVMSRAQLVVRDQNWATGIQGTDVDWPSIRVWPLAMGEFFTSRDVERASKVVVLGRVVRDQLFGEHVNPVGQTMRVQGQPFTVIGVLTAKGQTGMGRDQDDTIVMPYTTVQKKLRGITYVHAIMVSTTTPRTTAVAVAQIAPLLRVRHHLAPEGPDDFMVRTVDEIADVLRQTSGTMTMLLTAIAGIALVVGGIGVMNIMLVSVTERTQEIGLRMAVGARGRDVLGQFLLEALMLTGVGGAGGVVLGAIAARLTTTVLGWPAAVSPGAVVSGLTVAVLTGVVFGLYPARRAAALDPIEAMRYE